MAVAVGTGKNCAYNPQQSPNHNVLFPRDRSSFILQTMKRTVNRCEFRLSLRNVHELNESTKQWEHQLLLHLHLCEML